MAEWFRQGTANPCTAVRFRSPPPMTSTFTRGVPLHARIYDRLCAFQEKRGLLDWRLRLVEGLQGDVLEIGTGTGRNLAHYDSSARVLATEFDPVMFGVAVPRAEAAQAEVKLCLADGTRLPFGENEFDAVVIGLALCSIPDPQLALAEIARVLKPGGRFRFMEHVRGEDGTLLARVQDIINPAWRVISGGCNCNRRTPELVRASGLELEDLRHFRSGPPWNKPHVLGEARLV